MTLNVSQGKYIDIACYLTEKNSGNPIPNKPIKITLNYGISSYTYDDWIDSDGVNYTSRPPISSVLYVFEGDENYNGCSVEWSDDGGDLPPIIM